jgi:hypothetical protein
MNEQDLRRAICEIEMAFFILAETPQNTEEDIIIVMDEYKNLKIQKNLLLSFAKIKKIDLTQRCRICVNTKCPVRALTTKRY